MLSTFLCNDLVVSESTLKRKCRLYDIPEWPHNINKDHQGLSGQVYLTTSTVPETVYSIVQSIIISNKSNTSLPDSLVYIQLETETKKLPGHSSEYSPCSSQPDPKQVATVASFNTSQPENAPKDVGFVTVKATYRDDIIKFELPCASKMVDLRKEVTKRLKLKIGSFEIKYLDEDEDWVLIACDEDLGSCIATNISLGRKITKMMIPPITNGLL